MQIIYLGHAGFLVRSHNYVLLMDPWFSHSGAFDRGWFQFPRNHFLEESVVGAMTNKGLKRFVYISHHHGDHFDPDFLKKLPLEEVTLLIPAFESSPIYSLLIKYGLTNFVKVKDQAAIPFSDGYIKIAIDDSGLEADSAILVKSDDETFLNLNDCKAFDSIGDILRSEKLDTFACQFSGATWHPTCYHYTKEKYASISRERTRARFNLIHQTINRFTPKRFIPSAGPACFLAPELLHLNFENDNIFPRTEKLVAFLNSQVPSLQTDVREYAPGDEIDTISEKITQHPNRLVKASALRTYIENYSKEFYPRLPEKTMPSDAVSIETILSQLKKEIEQKLEVFTLSHRVKPQLYIGVFEAPHRFVKIDFQNRTVGLTSEDRCEPFYEVLFPQAQMVRLLERQMGWEDLVLGFRAKVKRVPDLFEAELMAFIFKETHELPSYCKNMEGLSSSQDRCKIESPHGRYEINRRCPHQGANLDGALFDDAGLLVCPRHGWKFDLRAKGKCTLNDKSIHAKRATTVIPAS